MLTGLLLGGVRLALVTGVRLDLPTQLMISLGAGILPNTRENLRAWIKNPVAFKPGALMPPMGLTDEELDAVTDYLMTLR